ncbi:Solute carrier family 12 member 2 [Halotydeus destructor]|nr:Solute carrier family 12 member 2 [Halotydeus destructor]
MDADRDAEEMKPFLAKSDNIARTVIVKPHKGSLRNVNRELGRLKAMGNWTVKTSKSMADITANGSSDKKEKEKRITGSKSSEWVEMSGDQGHNLSANGDSSNQQQSRFHVAKVSDASKNHGNGDEDDYGSQDDGAMSPAVQRTVGHNTNSYYDTKNLKSLRYYTREALPRADHYRNILSVHGHMNRPTMDELHGGGTLPSETNKSKHQTQQPVEEATNDLAFKFGWIQGVFVRCLLNIWGVMLFLRLSWVVANAGIGNASMIIILASCVTTITSLSMSAICTNGEVKGGGTYYMISRSLGPEVGGSIGLIFSLANAVAIAMYTVGFAETLQEVLAMNGFEMTGTKLNDVRIIGCVTVCLLLGVALIGTEWESKAQVILLIVLLLAMLDFLVGSVIPPTDLQVSRGYLGWNSTLIVENFSPDFRNNQGFFSVFAVFFPAATGILAGANISGDLKDPQHAIPLGTLLAIGVTTASYLLFAFVVGATVSREANGSDKYFANLTEFGFTTREQAIGAVLNCSSSNVNGTVKYDCAYGSHNFVQVMELVSAWGPIIYAGIFAATLSSALASLVSAPKVFQALCKDKLFPYIDYFAVGTGKTNEPRRGYFLAFGIAVGCCIIGELNLIAPIISNFFLAAYCLINFSCFHASFAKSLGFRPSFKYYNMWASLAGAVLCLLVMFIMDWVTALITFLIILGLYIFVLYRKPDVNWGSSTQAQTYRSAIQTVYKLNLLPSHVKNYRPQALVLTGCPSTRPALVDFAYSITKGIGMIVCGHAVQGTLSNRARNAIHAQGNEWLQKRKIKGFFNLVEEETFSRGVRSMFQSIGIGKLRPNLVVMGYKQNWTTCDKDEMLDYFQVIHETFDRHLSLAIIRVPEGLDHATYEPVNGVSSDKAQGGVLNNSFVSIEVLPKSDSEANFDNVKRVSRAGSTSSRESSPPPTPMLGRLSKSQGIYNVSQDPSGIEVHRDIPKDVLMTVNQFQRKQKKGTIDVWWLYDDGGLTMLVPFILSTRNQWSGCRLRVFALANKKNELDREQRNMAALLSKFRIDYSDVTVIPDVVKQPQQASKDAFSEIIAKFREKSVADELSAGDGTGSAAGSGNNDEENKNPWIISESEELSLKDKTHRHLRLKELLNQYSRDASLVVMTLPMPRKGTVSAPLYMGWIEHLTRNMPPFLLIRGNQESVLTYYS